MGLPLWKNLKKMAFCQSISNLIAGESQFAKIIRIESNAGRGYHKENGSEKGE